MRIRTILVSVVTFCFSLSHAQRIVQNKNKPVMTIVEGIPFPGISEGYVELTTSPVRKIGYKSEKTQTVRQKLSHGPVKWALFTSEPLIVYGTFWGNKFITYILEPGDSIKVEYKDSEPLFSGRGATKFNLLFRLEKVNDSIEQLNVYKDISHESAPVISIKDYLKWDTFLDQKVECLLSVIEKYRAEISVLAYDIIKERTLKILEEKRVSKFNSLLRIDKYERTEKGEAINYFGLTNKDLVLIYDSTLNGPAAKWLQNESPITSDPWYLYYILVQNACRKRKKFFKESQMDSSILGKGADRYVLLYNEAQRKYKGRLREEVLAFIFWFSQGVLKSVGFEPKVEMILADYYSQSKYPEYREYVKKWEVKQRLRHNAIGSAPNFVLNDVASKPFIKENLVGKLVVLYFWHTELDNNALNNTVKSLKERFKNDTNILFVNVSVERNKKKWLKNIPRQDYLNKNNINLYTGGQGRLHPIIRNYGVNEYPSLCILNHRGEMTEHYSPSDGFVNTDSTLLKEIERQLVYMMDGPYVWHHGNFTTAYQINGNSLIQQQYERSRVTSLNVQTDELGKIFSVPLKGDLTVEAAEYDKPKKMFVLSDIEGNFEAFRKLLQANNIIDKEYNWTFGDGHLVFNGDMFDRGKQVTECLWLIYVLEEKAKKAGGYVHFILGNHEIMNLKGNHKYVQQKYKYNALLLQRSLKEIYNEDSEIGMWLRSKNIIEKIGDLLFVHGGIKKEISDIPMSLKEINELARPFYASKNIDSSNTQLLKLYNFKTSPFWAREYYDGKIIPESELTEILKRFRVNRIITGHTIVSDTVSIHYNGRVINVDTKHAEGKSEALFIEADNYYRVNGEGKRRALPINTFRDHQYAILP